MSELATRLANVSATSERRHSIGGSDARIIMGNDEAALLRLWREKRGEAERPDYSDNLLVQLGLATEPLNRRWFERTTGQVIKDVQSWVRHPVIRWMAATLDGVIEGTGAVFEAKFMLPWSFSEEAAAEKPVAQVQHKWGYQCNGRGALDHSRLGRVLKSVSTSVQSLRGAVVLPSGMDGPADAWPMPQLQR